MRIFLFLLLLVSAASLRANPIDQLRTRADVTRFLKRQFKLKSALKVDSFLKSDLNGDGLTDLVVSGEWLMVVMDRGNGRYSYDALGSAPFDDYSARLVGIDPLKRLIVSSKGSRDTLVYRDAAGGFMEYNVHPSERFELDSVRIDVGPCFGSCPVYNMTVHPDRSVDFDGQRGYRMLSVTQYDTLLAILKYLPLKRLKSKYAVSWTDDRSFFTEITQGGRLQQISDYGGRGSFGLTRLYDYFDDLAAGFEH